MIEALCTLCGCDLVSNTVQIRADDEGATLVKWCPVHGINYNIWSKYSIAKSSLGISSILNPMRCTKTQLDNYLDNDGLRFVETQHLSEYIPSNWIECEIVLDSKREIPECYGEASTEEFHWKSSTITFNGRIVVSRIWTGNFIMSRLSCTSVTRVTKQLLFSSSIAEISKITINLMPPTRSLNTSNSMSVTFFDLSTSNDEYPMFVVREAQGDRFIMYVNADQNKHTYESLSFVAASNCAKILRSAATVQRIAKWNSWRTSCLSILSDSNKVSTEVSEVQVDQHAIIQCIESKGVFSIIYMCSEFVMMSNRAVSKGTLINALLVDGLADERSFMSTGYLSELTFNGLNIFEVDNRGHIDLCNIDIDNIMSMPDDSVITLGSCIHTNTVSNTWRIVYLGDQMSIQLTRRPLNLQSRIPDTCCILELIHKKIVTGLTQAANNRLDITVVIKSKPFRFIKELCNKLKCIFVYYEDWNSIEDCESR
jgi:hypothetical protein